MAAWEAPPAIEAVVTAATSKACPTGALPVHRVTNGIGGTLGVAAALTAASGPEATCSRPAVVTGTTINVRVAAALPTQQGTLGGQ